MSREMLIAEQMLALAALIERWAEALPRGHGRGSEPWDVSWTASMKRRWPWPSSCARCPHASYRCARSESR